jgi:hypothetical protein
MLVNVAPHPERLPGALSCFGGRRIVAHRELHLSPVRCAMLGKACQRLEHGIVSVTRDDADRRDRRNGGRWYAVWHQFPEPHQQSSAFERAQCLDHFGDVPRVEAEHPARTPCVLVERAETPLGEAARRRISRAHVASTK